ncbi:DUF4432 family protein [Ruminiclostridium cellobioparum]|uniref:DUF4432 domain-containing protein n=1 Tax=Ruminiclostridium cellobioparum subsp. termitidis CT1112 TaxID=1195236 RepID=S0FGK8_RUMCE|nr:DUF4432 family protein [Ruminiclostridium cellobioparum]EMS70227.1 hypothetical protein CTER_4061 [Ruminiclostridium cellobioparum subsp. termitidis CT1112]
MCKENIIHFGELAAGARRELPHGGFMEKRIFKDRYGSSINILRISNGLLTFTAISERGMDMGEIFLGEEKITWDRGEEYLLHPDNVNLCENGGWEKGFYAAVAALGPEIFGTPDEVRTVHGTGSYSRTILESISISWDREQICLKGIVPIKGYRAEPVYEKNIKIFTRYNSSLLVRKDSTRNLTGERQPLDDGFHIQPAGGFVSKGGRYILPVAVDKMLLRDSAPKEENPLEIYGFSLPLDPIRCYQYVPEPVNCLKKVKELNGYLDLIEESGKITAEMIVNAQKDKAAFVIRPLGSFPRSLIAKRADETPMYALEPCRTRPNSLRQKAIDGELAYLEPYEQADSWIIIGAASNISSILLLEDLIEAAGR